MTWTEIEPSHALPFLAFAADLKRHDPATFFAWFDREWSSATFAEYVGACRTARRDWRPKTKQISETTYVMTDAEGVIGVGILRFPLTPEIERTGGNFFFVVAPARRGRKWGPVLLNRLLFEGARAGLARAWVTCASANVSARRCIELNRGLSAGRDGGVENFWIPLR